MTESLYTASNKHMGLVISNGGIPQYKQKRGSENS